MDNIEDKLKEIESIMEYADDIQSVIITKLSLLETSTSRMITILILNHLIKANVDNVYKELSKLSGEEKADEIVSYANKMISSLTFQEKKF
jgi:hypothetical protein